MLVDSHCHLDYDTFAEDGLSNVIARAREVGVQQMLTICVRIAEFERVLKTAQASPYLDCTVGTHPHQADEEAEKKFTTDDIIKLAENESVVGIGETGLDYFYDNAPVKAQKENFRKHIKAAIALDLPIIIHSRDADEDMIQMLRDEGQGKLRGVLHCFSSGPELCKAALDLGFYISISGIITFKKAEELREIVRTLVPLDRLLVETDAPYLAPVPMRGKTNEPSFVVHTARAVAELKNITEDELAQVTTQNYFTLFNKAEKRQPA
tara:strand:+ start:1970 stop:2767 length:798 start_codon:yes stop_codon:yes gene_type:complete